MVVLPLPLDPTSAIMWPGSTVKLSPFSIFLCVCVCACVFVCLGCMLVCMCVFICVC